MNDSMIAVDNFEKAYAQAKIFSNSEFVPKDYYKKPENILVAWQFGMELGLKPMQSLQNIAVINGRPALWGDACLAVAMSNPNFISIKEYIENEPNVIKDIKDYPDNMTAVAEITRMYSDGPVTSTYRFSVADARRADLWGKNTWNKYPKRMLQMRPRGFALRDNFADSLKGIKLVEELQDSSENDFKSKNSSSSARDALNELLPEKKEPIIINNVLEDKKHDDSAFKYILEKLSLATTKESRIKVKMEASNINLTDLQKEEFNKEYENSKKNEEKKNLELSDEWLHSSWTQKVKVENNGL